MPKIVIRENARRRKGSATGSAKLDDSGRDVIWQALKYAAYCSSLKKAEIVGIFQQYLDRQGGGDAAGLICEFLG